MPPAKLACKGCRLSKVKCDLEVKENGKCSRCERLGLACLPTGPSKRGRPHTARDISRLGPAVRKLLVDGKEVSSAADGATSAEGGEECTAIGPYKQHMQVDKLVCKRDIRAEACRVLTSHLDTREARWAWMRHILYITQRARALEGMANAFMSAHEMGFTLDEVQAALSEVDPAALPDDEPLPDFLGEWYADGQISLTRYQNAGTMEWIPSRAFEEVFGVEGKLDAGIVSMLENAADRAHIVSITGRLWAQIRSGPEADAHTQHVQVDGDRDLEFTLKKGKQRIGPFRLRGRIVVKDRSLKTWTCINLVPAAPPAIADVGATLGLSYPMGLCGEVQAPPAMATAAGAAVPPPHQPIALPWPSATAPATLPLAIALAGVGAQGTEPVPGQASPLDSLPYSASPPPHSTIASPSMSQARSTDDASALPPAAGPPPHDSTADAPGSAALAAALGVGPDDSIALAELDALFTGDDNFDMDLDELHEVAADSQVPLEQLLALVSSQ